MRKTTSLALAALAVALLAPSAARGHGVDVEVQRSAAGIAVRARYEGGRPLADAIYEVVSPAAPGRAHDEGRTDRHGWLVFVPDAPGTWTVRIVDASGHGKVQEIDVPAETVAAASAPSAAPGLPSATAAPGNAGAAPPAAPASGSAPMASPAIPRESAAEASRAEGKIYRVIGGLAVIMLVFFVVFAVLIRRPFARR